MDFGACGKAHKESMKLAYEEAVKKGKRFPYEHDVCEAYYSPLLSLRRLIRHSRAAAQGPCLGDTIQYPAATLAVTGEYH